MSFTVHAPDPTEVDPSRIQSFLHGSASYSITVAGCLVVDDGEGVRRTYAPGAWLMIEEPTPEPPDPMKANFPPRRIR